MRLWTLPLAAAFALLTGRALDAQPPGEASRPATATFLYLSRAAEPDPRQSLTDPVVADYGWLGARFGLSELNANGRFLGKQFALIRVVVAAQEDLRSQARSVLSAHPALIVADLSATDLLTLADLPEAKNGVIIDARTSDDTLRGSQCRRAVFHVLPSWEMRAWALAEFLVAKGWRRWLLLSGPTEDDRAYTGALRGVARTTGVTIVSQSSLPDSGAKQSLTQAQIDAQLERQTRASAPYDMVVVADSTGTVGERVMFNTAASRLVAGTQGLRATAWDPQFRDFAARGFEYRFAQFAAREMSERDYGNWLAVTVLGEAMLRGGVSDPAAVREFLQSRRFSVAAFKGEALTFAADQQLRQPILLFGPKVLIKLAPANAHREAAGDPSGGSRCNLRGAATQ